MSQLKKNWIFDQYDFIKHLTLTLYNINLEASKRIYDCKRKFYTSIYEKQITKYFTKENIVERINMIKFLKLNKILMIL